MTHETLHGEVAEWSNAAVLPRASLRDNVVAFDTNFLLEIRGCTRKT